MSSYQLFSIHETATADNSGNTLDSPFTTGGQLFNDSNDWAIKETRRLAHDLLESDKNYTKDLNSLLAILNMFDIKFDNYFDDSLEDVSDELINQRKQKNSKLIKTVRTIILQHHELQRILSTGNLDLVNVKFSEWALNISQVYEQYVSFYKLNINQSTTEIHLRRRPLVRIRMLNKFVTKLKELVAYQEAKNYTSEMLSNLEVANHRLTISLTQARKVDDRERAKVENQVHFGNVKSIESLVPAASSFDAKCIESIIYDTEMFYKNETSESLLSFSNIQILFLNPKKGAKAIGLVKVEDAGKSLIFPTLSTQELAFIGEAEDKLMFRHCSHHKVEIYLKVGDNLELKSKLLKMFPAAVKSNKTVCTLDPSHKEVILKSASTDRTQSLGLGINIPQPEPNSSSLEGTGVSHDRPPFKDESPDTSPLLPPPRNGRHHIYRSQLGVSSAPDLLEDRPTAPLHLKKQPLHNFSNVSLSNIKKSNSSDSFMDFRINKDTFYSACQEQGERDTYKKSQGIDIEKLTRETLTQVIDDVSSDDQSEDISDSESSDVDVYSKKLGEQRELSQVETKSQAFDKENFNPQEFAKNYENVFGTSASLQKQQQKKKRQSIFNVFSSFMGMKKDTNRSVVDLENIAPTESNNSNTSKGKSKSVSAGQFRNQKIVLPGLAAEHLPYTQESNAILSEHNQIYLQDAKFSQWKDGKWTSDIDVSVKLIIASDDSYIVGYASIGNDKNNALFLAKIQSDFTIKRFSSIALQISTNDYLNKPILFLLKTSNADNSEKLVDILNMKKNGFISNSASEQSNLSIFTKRSTSVNSFASPPPPAASLHSYSAKASSLSLSISALGKPSGSFSSSNLSSISQSPSPSPTSLVFPKSIKIRNTSTATIGSASSAISTSTMLVPHINPVKTKLLENKTSKLMYQSLANVYKIETTHSAGKQNKKLLPLNRAILRVGNFQSESYLQILIKNTSISLDLVMGKANFKKVDGTRTMVNCTDYGISDTGNNWYLLEFGKKVDSDQLWGYINELS